MNRYKRSTQDLLTDAARTIEGQEFEINRLKAELFQIRQKVNFFFFGPDEERNQHIGLSPYNNEPSLPDLLKGRAQEIEDNKAES